MLPYTLPICERQPGEVDMSIPEVHVCRGLVRQVWGGSPRAACGLLGGGRRLASRKDGNGPDEGGRCFVMRRERYVTDTGVEAL